ncbi:acetyl-CoA synthetase-like protein [Annulohypoxylon maeteangense]|uniref:acetyl-CoA synthetase-like protein n=1 Tax=Annulohypoxylon maeteangense TaxID=1927788 RepID=UPI002007260E|nr:acetyl-CoA synthetase-like protein [Annulohypoxylon maeteangense]KAI0881599.1 acetyl-CoA synthetase-like protein [Annulohypoxylon maeteangense]
MRVYSSGTIDIPRDLNLTEFLHKSAYPDLPESHLIAKDSLTNRSITIGELRSRAGRIANGLKTKLNPVDQARWAIILPNSVDFLELFHAILWTGGIVCPINHALKATEIGHGLAVSRPHFIVSYGAVVPLVKGAVQLAKTSLSSQGVTWPIPQIITIITPSPNHPHLPSDFIQPTPLPIPHHPDTRVRQASIHLSSGTTGKSKGVALTHHNFLANSLQLLAHDAAQFTPDTRTVAYTPWTHIAMTTLPLFLGPYTGMLHHAMPSYSLEEFARLVGSDQATTFQGVPSVVLQLANSDVTARFDFSRARFINVGGPLKREVREKLYGKAPWKLVQVYGMTEAAGYVAYQKAGETLEDGVTGKLLPGIEARLVREGREEDVPEGEPGELWLRGPNFTRGYAFDDGANERAFSREGWYNTGDVCRIDAEGRVSVVGRTKDLIKYKGFQVSPAELEALVNACPDVVEGGVGAVWDESQLTELPAAWVILKDGFGTVEGKRKALREVHDAVDAQVSGYKKLRGGVWEVKTLPKNATGKILRKQLVEMRDGLCSLEEGSLKAKL